MATQAASNNVLSSSDGPASDASGQPQTAPITPAITDQSQLQRTLSILGPCVSASCVSVVIDLPETPIDAPALETTSLDLPYPGTPAPNLPYPGTPAPNPIYVVDPEPISVFTPQPLKPIPEASTWVMTVIGFSIMAFVFGKKRRPRINPISIIDVAGD